MAAFTDQFEIEEILPVELANASPSGDWDLFCFNFDFPEMNGLKLIPDTKRRWPSVPVLLLTMQNSADLSLWALRSGVFDVLVKPLTAVDIACCLRRVSTALQARRTQSERKAQFVAAPLPAETRYRPCGGSNPRLNAVISHIARHYAQPASEAEMALLCAMSPSRFCREFKTAFGVTYLEYLCDQRISHARRLLANPSMSVSDVASAVGFDDPSYFARVFRKQEGVTPTDYRAGLQASSGAVTAL